MGSSVSIRPKLDKKIQEGSNKANRKEARDILVDKLNVLDQLSLFQERPAIYILFSPPEYDPLRCASLLSEKLLLPVIDAVKVSENSCFGNVSCAVINVATNNKYKRGYILINFCYALHEISKIISSSPELLKLPIFLNCSKLTLFATVKSRWDKYIHKPSGRVYHLTSNPPLSYYEFGLENLVDDLTSDPLDRLVEDTPEYFKALMERFESNKNVVESYFKLTNLKYYVIDCTSLSMRELKRQVLFVIQKQVSSGNVSTSILPVDRDTFDDVRKDTHNDITELRHMSTLEVQGASSKESFPDHQVSILPPGMHIPDGRIEGGGHFKDDANEEWSDAVVKSMNIHCNDM